MGVCAPRVCCCGASLRVGTITIGMITLVLFGLDLVSVILIGAFKFEEVKRGCVKADAERDFNDSEPAVQFCVDLIMGIFTAWGIISFIVVICSLLLLLGVNKNRPGLLMPYMVGQVISIVICGLVCLSPLPLSYLGIIGGPVVATIMGLILLFVLDGLQIYLFLIVLGYYKELKLEIEDLTMNPEGGVRLNKM